MGRDPAMMLNPFTALLQGRVQLEIEATAVLPD
jgi:hypothetical protein